MNQRMLKNKIKQASFVPSKKMGQNFLSSNEIKQKIIKSANVLETDYILEIGPGYGAITEHLIPKAKKVLAIELDKRLFDHLKTNFKFDNFSVINNDVLKVDLDQLLTENEFDNVKVVANLPYSISSKIVLKLIKSKKIKASYIMVQKEMAERIAPKINTKGYNAFSVLVQLFADTKMLFKVPNYHFVPAPKVESAVIEIVNKDSIINFDIIKIEKFLRICFLNRRKKLSNNLLTAYSKDKVIALFNKFELDPNIRAENISGSLYVEMYKFLSQEM
ncbi:16S rRNA methyltransferase [Ureaplasma diversum]|uniref:Ribosomal RNA small subunit methyltransferase A n=1 Tax=Ureaplasma diversum TaxID=42094 RepID=A0A0C5RCK6_9BACT|nr:16S rRNA (adenine(1518)-N(6)/adenine(1519)-N(6))-dimethyltransferase RsmA [Ureaplasma diversum]AJQ45641.1 16S rRNA methyltransferase [Ureaplasma diversum]